MITQRELKKVLHYNPETGVFTWNERPLSMFNDKRRRNIWNAKYAGKAAGTIRNDGYIGTTISGRGYVMHRLAWLYIYGEFPEEQTDHINHDKTDNRIANLRCVSAAQNSQNRNISKLNTSGCTGVYKKGSGWRAELKTKDFRVRGKTQPTIELAIADRERMIKDHGFHPNHGQSC